MREADNSSKAGLHSGGESEEQEQSGLKATDADRVASHLFLASGAEILRILQPLRPSAEAAHSPKEARALLDTVYAQTAKVSGYSAQSPEELFLKTLVFFGLIDAGMHDACSVLGKSILEDAHRLRDAGAEIVPQEPESPSSATADGYGNIVPRMNLGELASLVEQMVETVRQAVVPPSQLTVFAPPIGSYAAAAAMIACVERVLKLEHGSASWTGLRVAVFGATGAVGFAASVLAALEGAHVQLAAHAGSSRLNETAAVAKQRFDVDLEPVSCETDDEKKRIISGSEVVLAAASTSTRVIDTRHMALAEVLTVVADANLVPPSGVEGMEPYMNGTQLPGCIAFGIGPLTIANMRRKIELHLLVQRLSSAKPLSLSLEDVLALARQLAG